MLCILYITAAPCTPPPTVGAISTTGTVHQVIEKQPHQLSQYSSCYDHTCHCSRRGRNSWKLRSSMSDYWNAIKTAGHVWAPTLCHSADRKSAAKRTHAVSLSVWVKNCMVPADSECGLPAKPPKFVTLSNPMIEEMESNLMYQAQGVDHCLHSPTTTKLMCNKA